MIELHGLPLRKLRTAVLVAIIPSGAASQAQDISQLVSNPDPLGLTSFIPDGARTDLGIEGKFKGDLSYGIGVESVYDSNFFLTEEDPESEMSALFSPWVRYVSDPEGGATFSFVANYTPSYRTYVENPDLNGLDQSGDIVFSMRGSRTKVDVFASRNAVSNTDRLTGEFVEATVSAGGIIGSRQIGPRTSLEAGWSYVTSDYGSSESEGVQVSTFSFGGNWEAGSRVSLGTSLRYTTNESETTGSRDAWALLGHARYRVGEKLLFSASLGPEYSRNSGEDGEESSLGMTGDIRAKYAITERWSWTNSLRSATVPSANEANYLLNSIYLTTALQREFVRGSMNFGLTFTYSEYSSVGDTETSLGNEQNTILSIGYQRPLFSERIGFNCEARYAVNKGEEDWSQFIISAGLNASF